MMLVCRRKDALLGVPLCLFLLRVEAFMCVELMS